MKKIIGLCFLLTSTLLFSEENFNNLGEVHHKFLSNRGKEQFRNNIVFNKFERNGYSNSNQFLEYLGEITRDYYGGSNYPDYDVKTKGFLMGTTSNLVSNPDVYVGVNLGYFKSNLNYDNENSKVRTYGIDYYLGKEYYKNWLVIGKIGYSENKNIYTDYKYRTKNYSLEIENGYFLSLGEKSILYSYVSLDWNQYTIKSHNNIETTDNKIGSSSLGLTYTLEFYNKFLLMANGEWLYEFDNKNEIRSIDNKKFEKIKTDKNTGIFNIKLGYFIKPEFLISLGYSSFINKNYYYDMFSLTLSHNF